MTKHNLYLAIEEIRTMFKISESAYPLSFIDMVNNMDDVFIEYLPFKNEKIGGMFLRGEKQHTIVLNKYHTPEELNFDCGHEIMHGIFDSQNSSMEYSFNMGIEGIRSVQDPFKEWRANEGAAEFLIPYKYLLPKIAKEYASLNNWRIIESFKQSLAYDYNVTTAVIHFRIESLKYELQQYINGTALEDIVIVSNTKLKEGGIDIKSLNDIEMEDFALQVQIQPQKQKYRPNYRSGI